MAQASPKTPSNEDVFISQAPSIHVEGHLLLKTIKENLPELEERLNKANGHWQGEDGFYRFYHGSLKVYFLQKETDKMLKAIEKIKEQAGIKELNEQFLEIVRDGTNKTWSVEHNKNWGHHTRPILEAFFHTREMIRLMIKYGKTLTVAPNMLPSGWAAVLYLFNLR